MPLKFSAKIRQIISAKNIFIPLAYKLVYFKKKKKVKMKKISIAVFALLFATTAFAQKSNPSDYPRGFRLGFGLSGGFDTNSDYDFGLGADVRLQYDLSRKTSLTLTSGYTHLFAEEDAGFIPAKIGFKSFVSKNIYLMAEGGAAVSATSDFDSSALLAPSIGFANRYIDVSIRYENYLNNDLDQLGLRIAYGFSLK